MRARLLVDDILLCGTEVFLRTLQFDFLEKFGYNRNIGRYHRIAGAKYLMSQQL